MGFSHICFTAFAVYLLFFRTHWNKLERHKFDFHGAIDASFYKTGILWIWKRVINEWKSELHCIIDPKGIYLTP